MIDFLERHPEAREDADNGPELQALLDAIGGPTIVMLPPGRYRFETPVVLDRRIHDHPVVLRGAGWEATRLEFAPRPGGDAKALFVVRGIAQRADATPVLRGAERDSRRLQVQNGTQFQAGDTVLLRQDNDLEAMGTYKERDRARILDALQTWARRATGQVVRVEAVDGDTLHLARPLYRTLDWGGLTAERVTPRSGVGFEHFTATNLHDEDDVYLFILTHVADCWIRDVHSVQTVKFHVQVISSRNVTIADSFFDGSFRHGGGGHGYGVALEWATSDCLTINNLFRRLRHSMMFAKGVTGNVYAYNYSFDNRQDGAPVAKDLSGHGHYPSMNLLEGNVVQFIHGSDFWGSLGPGNTYFRNRVTDVGICLDVYSPGQNAIANEITAPPSVAARFAAAGSDYRVENHVFVHETVRDPLIFANVTPDDPIPPPDTPPPPPSLFLEAPPAFWPAELPWPALGPPHRPGSHPIPAMRRWASIAATYP